MYNHAYIQRPEVDKGCLLQNFLPYTLRQGLTWTQFADSAILPATFLGRSVLWLQALGSQAVHSLACGLLRSRLWSSCLCGSLSKLQGKFNKLHLVVGLFPK